MISVKLGSDKMYYGIDAIQGLKLLPSTRKKAFIVMSGTILAETGALKVVTNVLDEVGFVYEVYSDVEPEPSFESVKAGAEEMKRFEPDWVIGFGGGSAMDAAKAMWVFYENPELSELEEVAPPNVIPKLKERARVCCIPTSAGTGSEVTRAALIKDNNKKRKYSIRCMNGRMIPDVAILDPIFTISMPKSLTSSSGMDAITHAIESYVTPIANPFSNAMSVTSFINSYHALPICYETGDNLDARAKMLSASCMGGIAFSNSALGIAHSIAHAFGAEFGVPHGLANAIVLPYNIKFNLNDPTTAERYYELARFIGKESLLDAILELAHRVQIPTSMNQVVKDEELFLSRLDVIVEKAMGDICTSTAPVVPNADIMKALIVEVYYGK